MKDMSWFEENEPKGEMVVVIEGKDPKEIQAEKEQSWQEMSLEEHVEYYVAQGFDEKEAMKLVAKDRGISKRDVYDAIKK